VLLTADNREVEKIKENSAKLKQTLQTKCIDCVEDFETAYIVVNINQFPLLKKEVIAEKDGFIIYKGNQE
jgi:hypothetical protein